MGAGIAVGASGVINVSRLCVGWAGAQAVRMNMIKVTVDFAKPVTVTCIILFAIFARDQ